jgi:hypothetical protein
VCENVNELPEAQQKKTLSRSGNFFPTLFRNGNNVEAIENTTSPNGGITFVKTSNIPPPPQRASFASRKPLPSLPVTEKTDMIVDG